MAQESTKYLAQINITKSPVDLDDPSLSDFFAAVDRVNAVAERSDGFVWRYISPPEGDGLDDPRLLVNMSVWEAAEQFEHFVWNTIHKKVYARKDEWFEKMQKPHFAMWWVAPGDIPSLQDGFDRLDHLHVHGSSEEAFGWEGLPHIRKWMSKQCG